MGGRFMNIGFNIPDAVYNDGISFEIDHHRKWLCGKPCNYTGPDFGWFKYEKRTKLKGLPVEPHRTNLCKMIAHNMNLQGKGNASEVLHVLDHGAGPFTNLGKRFTCREPYVVDAQVTAVDPLAPLYHGILNEFGVYDTLRTAYCPSERLTACIGPDNVDMSIIINALDHSSNALEAWLQSVWVTRLGGLCCVHSIKNEATHMQNAGFHQWNFDIDNDGNWIMMNTALKKRSNTMNIDQVFKGVLVPLDNAQAGITGISSTQMFKCYRKSALINESWAHGLGWRAYGMAI
jgi:hypothetical protein